MQMPDLTSLLTGVVQPADFVKRWIQTPEALQDGLLSGESMGNGRRRAGGAVQERENQAKRRRLFDLALMRQDFELRARLAGIAERHHFRVAALLIANVLLLLLLLLLRLATGPDGAADSSGALGFVGILLLFPIASLFAYSRLLHLAHLQRQEIQEQRTRLAAATHAYETYEEIQRLQQRVLQREQKATTRETDRMQKIAQVESRIRMAKLREIEEFLRDIPQEHDVSDGMLMRMMELVFGSAPGGEGTPLDNAPREGK
jgi:hypothetical protein